LDLRAARSDGGSDLSSSESEFLHKRNSKSGGEWMQRQIVRLPTPFIGRRREGSSSMLPFWKKKEKGTVPVREGIDKGEEGE
jgi:hypothetical protein